MPILPILTGIDNPILRKKTKKVPAVTKSILKLIRDMEATMKKAEGVGLAAPQIGKSIRLCLVTMEGKLAALVNPKITMRSNEKEVDEEGCLSIPGVYLPIPRSVDIVVKYTDEKGKKQERKLSHFSARVVQHEVDHLEGVLIVDYAKHNVL